LLKYQVGKSIEMIEVFIFRIFQPIQNFQRFSEFFPHNGKKIG